MLKLAGMIIILIACGGIGLYLYRYTVYCVDYVGGLIDGIKFIRREIEFSEVLLKDAFADAAEYSGVSKDLFLKCSEDLNGYARYVNDEKSDAKTKRICENFFSQIGKSNLENELRLIDTTIDKLIILQCEHKKFSEGTGKLWAKSGILIGMLIVILLT